MLSSIPRPLFSNSRIAPSFKQARRSCQGQSYCREGDQDSSACRHLHKAFAPPLGGMDPLGTVSCNPAGGLLKVVISGYYHVLERSLRMPPRALSLYFGEFQERFAG
jgi:hypothetical protein